MGKRWFKYFIGYINHFDGNDIKPVSKLVDKVYIICAWKKKHGDILQYTYFKIWNQDQDLDWKDFDIEILYDKEYITTRIVQRWNYSWRPLWWIIKQKHFMYSLLDNAYWFVFTNMVQAIVLKPFQKSVNKWFDIKL